MATVELPTSVTGRLCAFIWDIEYSASWTAPSLTTNHCRSFPLDSENGLGLGDLGQFCVRFGAADTRPPLLLLEFLNLFSNEGDGVAVASHLRKFQSGFQVGEGFPG